MPLLSIENVSHLYLSKSQTSIALENISMSIEEGEFISFLGPSGCGKTTLLSIISGLFKPTEGSVKLYGKDVLIHRQDIGYMLQQDYLFPWKTIKENILIGLKLLKQLDQKHEEQTISLLEEIGLKDVLTKFPRELSGGMRQRVALVRTLATNPTLLLLDEPFSALDLQTKLKLEDIVSSTLKSFKKTAILVTHDIGEAVAMSDRVFLLSPKPGKIHKEFDIPNELKGLSPFNARNHPAFSDVFQLIWKEMEQLDG
ncbi:ABC transporter ATP-binding protein [Pradoshia sp. D12]|uniref:ABC transporter ATP-binding protein n=1 Tax=Bacillaceae TaxID=186817 RepID=UPI00080AC9FC|nr:MULTISPECIES: ABC transporter ATP-binding protein [Bacillaceae]OCA81909.1 spermidine/putrescine ABC transporter ATP-binding protein [Bacillus sp. FJAT-27986]QFK72585.1 ABC transporter ATP-binding protein [Pradoshia sp. D12]TPF70671.1 ABC transporter ATP-binding protein [Bacillus sp. D12]